MKSISVLLFLLLSSGLVSAQDVYNCKSKSRPASSENGIYNDVHFTLVVKKISTGTYKISVEVRVGDEMEDLSQSGYAEIFVVQNGEEISQRNWENWDEKQSLLPELTRGIYSQTFTNLNLVKVDKVIAKIALEGKKGTYQAEFSVKFLTNCKGIL